MPRTAVSLVLLTVLAGGLSGQSVSAQTDSAEVEAARARWRLSDVRQSFCVQWLLNPDSLRTPLPRGVRLLPADGNADLHPVLRQVVANQPEYRSWTPSALCFFRMGTVVAGSSTIQGGEDSAKAPVLGIWTVAAETGANGPRTFALDLRANDGDLREAADRARLELERLNITVGPVPRDDGRPSPDETRYQIRFGKTLLVWDGRSRDDSTHVGTAVAWNWQAVREKGGWLTGALTLKPRTSSRMIGSLSLAMWVVPAHKIGSATRGAWY